MITIANHGVINLHLNEITSPSRPFLLRQMCFVEQVRSLFPNKTPEKNGIMILKTQLQSSNNDIKTPRAVYIFRRPCIQTFQRLIIRYFNFCLRPVEDIFAFSHWGLVISSELPPSDTRPGENYKLLQDFKETSSTFELHVHETREKKKANVGSMERYFPICRTSSDVLMYVGQTSLTDKEIYSLGESALQILVAEGCYNGIYRNCQHFSRMMINELCPEVWCPKSVDRLFFGALRLWIFKGQNASMKERIKAFKAFHEAKLAEKETFGSKGSDEALQMDVLTECKEVHAVELAEQCIGREDSACNSAKLASDVREMEVKERKR